jgi:hypothetical protein
MGTWSEDAFGNDAACDWAHDFIDAPSIDKIKAALNKVVGHCKHYLDADITCECLVACELIARLRGHFGIRDSYSEDVDAWVLSNSQKVDRRKDELAIAAIDRIQGTDSELAELWNEADGAEWRKSLEDLRRRLIMD